MYHETSSRGEIEVDATSTTTFFQAEEGAVEAEEGEEDEDGTVARQKCPGRHGVMGSWLWMGRRRSKIPMVA